MTLFSARCGTLLSTRTVALSAGLVFGLLSVSSFAADGKGSGAVVATLNGAEVHESDLMELRATLPPQVAQKMTMSSLADMYTTNKLVADEARKEGLAKDPDVIRALKHAEDELVIRAWAAKKGRADIPDSVLKAKYDAIAATFKPQEEVHAHHILVDSEDQAKAVIADLRAGASFEDLAKTKSKDPTGARTGGDLGFFTREQMVPEFTDAAFSLRAGETSTTPVKNITCPNCPPSTTPI